MRLSPIFTSFWIGLSGAPARRIGAVLSALVVLASAWTSAIPVPPPVSPPPSTTASRPALAGPDTTEPAPVRPSTVRPDTTEPARSGVDTSRTLPQRTDRAAPARFDDLPGRSLVDRLRGDAAFPSDTLDADSLATNRLAGADSGRTARYLPRRRDRGAGTLFPRTASFLSPRDEAPDRSIALDSAGTHFTATDDARGQSLRIDPSTYRRERFRSNLRDNWSTLAEQRQQQRRKRGGLGVNIVVPGGRQSAFSTIFGKPQVDLRVNGQADIKAGVNYRKSDRQVAVSGRPGQIDPDFKQDLRLGVTGTIGDKMQIDVDWDTNNQFDYQNQVKLTYTGYEDEIIQSVEAGNVFLDTPSQLISGGQSLFGIKSQFQLGNLSLTTVASQQEGQSNTLSIEGGSETSTFDLQPTEYDDNTHYFLGYFFRNWWETALADPQTVRVRYDELPDIEVWKLRTTTNIEDGRGRNAVAVVDLGEPATLLQQADGYTAQTLPRPELDQYEDDILQTLRDGDTQVTTFLTSSQDLTQTLGNQDFVQGRFRKLEVGRDYTINRNLGYVSLKQRLRSDEALAVAYRYQSNGETVAVGDFSADQLEGSGTDTDRLVLKLLRPSEPVAPTDTQRPAAWFLEMRNIYRLGGRGFTQENFELDVSYDPPGQTSRTTVSEIAPGQTLLQVLGLDRLNQDGAASPDDQFDFTRQTIDAEEGLLIFPYLEPFGSRIVEAAQNGGNQAAAEEIAFSSLYLRKRENAQDDTNGKNVFHVRGSYKGSTRDFYDLKAFAGLIEGSVEVTAGGQTLQEGTDYVVDYQGGTVTITNESYLAEGRDIDISYEQNSFANIQQKTLLGARADWDLREKFALGATVMRLSEKSPVDKFRIGEEPIRNTIWGVDGSMDLEPRWLTRAVDALPLVQTKATSTLSLSGEFAQLRPGHSDTEAFERTREGLQDEGEDFTSDELGGISYVDDFEGFENTFSLRQQVSSWQVSAAPDSIASVAGLDGDDPSTNADEVERSHWRGRFGWYQLTENTREALAGKSAQRSADGATRIFNVTDIFERDVDGPSQPLRTLDFYFTPWERGPYNYTDDFGSFVRNPRRVWGGITQRLPQGYTDFSLQNIEFVEFIVRVFPEDGDDGDRTLTDGARLYVDLGSISEDVVPNQKLNAEDGLSTTFDPESLDDLSRRPDGLPDGNISVRGNRTDDLGLDGLVSYDPEAYVDPDVEGGDRIREDVFFADFLDGLRNVDRGGLSAAQERRLDAEIARSERDPSADDYRYFEDDRFFDDDRYYPQGATIQERYSRFYAGQELNGFESQNQLAVDVSERRGNSRTPDSEDLDGTGSSVEILNDYYQYAVPLDELEALSNVDEGPTDYVVSEIQNDGRNTGWYKVRIPVREFTRRVGTIDDFTRIRAMRMWTTGHDAPVTIRLASLELVGSQWRQSTPVADEPVEEGRIPANGEGELRVASINTEEDAAYERPLGAIVSRNRTARGGQQLAREQSLLLNVDRLEGGEQRGVFKLYNQGLDLLKYSNLRMYVHAEGGTARTSDVPDDYDEDLRVFVRLGANETSDYYEYEQPLRVSAPVQGDDDLSPQALWPQENEVNLVLSALNQLKVARDRSSVPLDEPYRSSDANVDTAFDDRPEAFRPELTIRGTPSLRTIKTIVIGVRHADSTQGAVPLDNVELWANELRVSGYDEKKGWAALGNASVDLADFGSVQGSFQRKTDGFGGLASTLSERQQSDNTSWSVRSDVNVDKLLPEAHGWQLPVTMQVQSSTTTPRFDPNRGDVRITEIQDEIESRDLDPQREQALKQQVVRESQTASLRRSLTANVSKRDSRSWWLRQTLDATSLSFSYFDRTARSPTLETDEEWKWDGSFEYRLQFGPARTLKPLWFLDWIPVVGALGDVQFNYVPQSLNFTSNVDRSVTETKNRSNVLRPDENTLPDVIANPIQERQTFNHRRSFGLQYNPFEFLNLGFDTSTQQSLNGVGATQQFDVYVLDEDRQLISIPEVRDTTAFFFDPLDFRDRASDPVRFERAVTDNLVVRDNIGTNVFVNERLALATEGDVARTLLLENGGPRTNRYQQRFNATIRPSLTDGEALNWVDLQDVVYATTFNWNNGAQGSITGASVSNDVSLRTGVNLHPNKVWERFGFFERMKEAQRTAEQEKQAERERRRREKEDAERQDAEREEADRQAAEPQDPGQDAPTRRSDETPPDDAPDDAQDRAAQERDAAERAAGAGEDESDGAADASADDGEAESDEAGGDEADADDGGPSWDDLPLPNPVDVGRRLALMVLDVSDISISYNAGRTSRSSNVGIINTDSTDVKTDYSLLDALGGRGPSLGYRFGFARTPGSLDQRALLRQTQATDAFDNTNRLDARTTLSGSRSFQIDLQWNVSWNTDRSLTFQPIPDGVEVPEDAFRTPSGRAYRRIEDEGGDNDVSVWAFGSYRTLFEQQLDRFERNANADPDETLSADDVALSNRSLTSDFQDAFLTGGGAIGSRGFLPFPMPNWNVRYTGLSTWPLIRSITRSASLQHAYNARYTSRFASVSSAGEPVTISLGGVSTTYQRPDFDVNQARVSERYEPLVGVDLTWAGDVQTSVDWNKTNTTELSTSRQEVEDLQESEVALSVTYRKRGLKIPLLPIGRLNNELSFTMSVARSKTDKRLLNLQKALQQAQDEGFVYDAQRAEEGDNVSIVQETSRLTVTPQLSYNFSNRVQARFLLEYERFNGDGRRPSFTNVNGGFDITVSISEN